MINFVISQVFGLVALVLVCTSYFTNNKSLFLLLNTFANAFYAAAYFSQNLFVAGLNTVISIARTAGLFILAKNDTRPDLRYFFIIIAAYFINLSIFSTSLMDLIVLLTSVLFTVAYFSKNMRFTRIIVIIPTIILIVYNLIFRLYASALLNLIEAVMALIAIIKNDCNFNRKQKNRQN